MQTSELGCSIHVGLEDDPALSHLKVPLKHG